MANVYVKDEGIKVRFSAKAKNGFVEGQVSPEEFLSMLETIAENSERHAYMADYFGKNGSLSIKSSNKYASELRAKAKNAPAEPVAKAAGSKKKNVKDATPAIHRTREENLAILQMVASDEDLAAFVDSL